MQGRVLLDGLQTRGRSRLDWEYAVLFPGGQLLLRHQGWHIDFDQLGADDAEIGALFGDRFAPVVGVLLRR